MIETVLAEQQSYGVALTEDLRARNLCSQDRESDLDLMQRLLAGEGLSP